MIDWLSTSLDTGRAMEAADYAWPNFQKYAQSLRNVSRVERRETSFVIYESQGFPVSDFEDNPLIDWLFSRGKSRFFMGVPITIVSDNVLK